MPTDFDTSFTPVFGTDKINVQRDWDDFHGQDFLIETSILRWAWISRDEARVMAEAILASLDGDTPGEPELSAAEQQENNEDVLRDAVDRDETVYFSYDGPSGIQSRQVAPESVHDGRYGPVVTGHDFDRNDVRAFRLDRIVGAVSL